MANKDKKFLAVGLAAVAVVVFGVIALTSPKSPSASDTLAMQTAAAASGSSATTPFANMGAVDTGSSPSMSSSSLSVGK